MKLISFAVVSFLAITVSAQPPIDSASNSALQHDQEVLDKIQELTTAHEAQKELVLELGNLEKLEQMEQETSLAMKKLGEELRKQIDNEPWRLHLQALYNEALENYRDAFKALSTRKEELKNAKEERNSIEMGLFTLKENWDRLTEHNAENQDQMTLWDGSYYNREILTQQSNEVCQSADDLSIVSQDIKEGMSALDKMLKRKKKHKDSEPHRIRGNLHYTFQDTMEQVEFMQDHCTYTIELQADFDCQSPSSEAGEVCPSFV
ncbi:hypothetical protein BASA83_011703 [Batrachochytrium salamandrivorans]|nr:hypothetical protein BASA62_007832 [Batrachochytrium salamandrivorans]KAH9264803.1 hypothetical protein BASA83_011703 [Batrachochytrium salamandrivorans]